MYSSSTLSKGIPILREVTKRVLGQKLHKEHWQEGSRALASRTEKIFPKLPLAAIFMYLTILPNVRLPSITPSSSTMRNAFSSRIMSAVSLAISTTLSQRFLRTSPASAREHRLFITHVANRVSGILKSSDNTFLLKRG